MTTITLDEIDGEQWEKLKALIASMPNAPHVGKSGERYGNYISIRAKPDVEVDVLTGELTIKGYRRVKLDVGDFHSAPPGSPEGYEANLESEKKQVTENLVKLIAEFF